MVEITIGMRPYMSRPDPCGMTQNWAPKLLADTWAQFLLPRRTYSYLVLFGLINDSKFWIHQSCCNTNWGPFLGGFWDPNNGWSWVTGESWTYFIWDNFQSPPGVEPYVHLPWVEWTVRTQVE